MSKTLCTVTHDHDGYVSVTNHLTGEVEEVPRGMAFTYAATGGCLLRAAVLALAMATAAVVVGCDYDYDNQDDFVIRDGYLCEVATDECEVLP